jgi:hypothetical protein
LSLFKLVELPDQHGRQQDCVEKVPLRESTLLAEGGPWGC